MAVCVVFQFWLGGNSALDTPGGGGRYLGSRRSSVRLVASFETFKLVRPDAPEGITKVSVAQSHPLAIAI